MKRVKKVAVVSGIALALGGGAWWITTNALQNSSETVQSVSLDKNKESVEQYSSEEAEKKKPISETKVGKIEEEVKETDATVDGTLTPFFKAMYSAGSFSSGGQVKKAKEDMAKYAVAEVVDAMTVGYGAMYQPSRPTIDGKGETGGSNVSYEMSGKLETGILSKTSDGILYTVIVPFTNSNTDSNKALFYVTVDAEGKTITSSDYKGTISRE